MQNAIKLSLYALTALTVSAFEPAGFEVEFLNRYVDLGEDVEPGSRFLRAGAGAGLHGFDLGLEAFQALGGGDYNEVSLTVSHDLELGALTLTPGFTWLWFPDDSNDTAEATLGFGLPVAGTLELFGEYAYDLFDSVGFLDVGLALPQTLPVGGRDVEITPSVTFGFDYGMVSGERGFTENHYVISLEINVPVADGLDVFANINQSYAFTAFEKEGGRDVSWFGLGMAYGF